MANNVQIQLQKAIEMKDTVKSFAKILTQRMNDLEETLSQYVKAGFPEDIAANYYNYYYSPDRAIIDDLSKDMLNRHVDYLDKVIAELTEAVNLK